MSFKISNCRHWLEAFRALHVCAIGVLRPMHPVVVETIELRRTCQARVGITVSVARHDMSLEIHRRVELTMTSATCEKAIQITVA